MTTRDHDAVDLGQAVIEAVAVAEDTDPIHLNEPLFEVISPEAMNMLFAGKSSEFGTISFEYYGYDVTVDRNGQVTLEPRNKQ